MEITDVSQKDPQGRIEARRSEILSRRVYEHRVLRAASAAFLLHGEVFPQRCHWAATRGRIREKVDDSPSFDPVFGRRMWRRKLLFSCLYLTQAHVSVEDSSKQCSAGARISPMRVDPKKATVAAVQMVCCVVLHQPDFLSLCPRCRSRGRVMTLLVFLGGTGAAILRFSAPLRMASTMLSFTSYSVKPFILWRQTKEDM